jgi:hypothetical protein
VMAKEGVLPNVTDMFSAAGNRQLDEMAPETCTRSESSRCET